MKNVTTIANGLWAKVQSGEVATAAVSLPDEVQQEVDRQTATVINGLFRQLRAIFPAWKQAWPDMASYKAAKQEWLQGFLEAGLSNIDQLRFGLMRARQSGKDFVPNPGVFIEWCLPSPEMLGLPPLVAAHRQACRNAHPSMAGQGNWSHDAVWHAAKESGFENLNRLAADLSLKLFERNYTIAVRRLLAGQPLQAMPLALPSRPQPRSTPEVARAALDGLRKARGARNA